jgi:cytochrome c553
LKHIIITAFTIGLLSPIVILAADAAHIRSLAASCAACHGTHGQAASGPISHQSDRTVALAGLDEKHILSQLLAYKSGAITATVMQRHAKGLSDSEIAALAHYFSQQPASAPAALASQKLRADHAH